MFRKLLMCVVILISVLNAAAEISEKETYFTDVYKQWKNGPPADPSFFPLAVWCQDVADAEAYKVGGINTYVGLWKGPGPGELEALKAAGMYVVCDQNKLALSKKDDRTIIAWMHGDEPDNAQSLPGGKGYGPCIRPSVIVSGYQSIKSRDSSRPIMGNFGQGLVLENYKGRGAGASINDYREYFKGADIVSFDVYPVVNYGADFLWYQAKGLDRITEFSGSSKIKWNCMESTAINGMKKPSPLQIKAEIWISILSGSKGIIYFCHRFGKNPDTRALLHDKEIFPAVTRINQQITELAPIINSPDSKGLSVSSLKGGINFKAALKQYKGDRYVFAVPMKNGDTAAKFEISGITKETKAEVLGESRTVEVSKKGVFKDEFKAWQVHLYKIPKE